MSKVLSRLKAGTVPVAKVGAQDRSAMYALYETYYANVTYEEFDRDLSKKNDVIILREASTKRIVGFTTILLMKVELKGRKVHAIFSGDTIVEKQFWGQTALHFEFARYFIMHKIKNPFTPFYWFLISKGYKTYLLLTNNFLNFYPRLDRETPPEYKELIKNLATTLYPNHFDSNTGLITFPYQSAHLKCDVAQIDAHLLATNPKVAFFQRQNPNWMQGSELCCVGELEWRLPLNYCLKVLRKKLKGKVQVKDLDFVENARRTPVKVTAVTPAVRREQEHELNPPLP